VFCFCTAKRIGAAQTKNCFKLQLFNAQNKISHLAGSGVDCFKFAFAQGMVRSVLPPEPNHFWNIHITPYAFAAGHPGKTCENKSEPSRILRVDCEARVICRP
jgi:hypothetical protein